MIAPDLETGIARLRDLVEQASGGGAVHRRRHLHRVRHPRLPLAWRHLDQDAADRLRRLPGQPGDAGRKLAAALRHGGAVRRRQARPRPPGAGEPLQGRQGAGRHHPEYRQSASGFRASPADHVVELHGNTTYATCLDCAKRYELSWVRERFTASGGRSPDCPGCGGYHQDRDRVVRPVDAGGGHAARPGADGILRPLPRHRLVAGGLAGGGLSRWPPSATARGSSSSIGTRPSSTKSPISCVHDDIGAALAPFIAH